MNADQSDDDHINPDNYKGLFYEQEEEKYQDPITGAHFHYQVLVQILTNLKKIRDIQQSKALRITFRNPSGQAFSSMSNPKLYHLGKQSTLDTKDTPQQGIETMHGKIPFIDPFKKSANTIDLSNQFFSSKMGNILSNKRFSEIGDSVRSIITCISEKKQRYNAN